MAQIIHLTTMAEFEAAKQRHHTLVIDAYADWCGPCKTMTPIFAALAKTHAATYPSMAFFKIDVGAAPELADYLSIASLPTFLFVRNGVVVNQVVGANRAQLEAQIQLESKGVPAP